MFSSNGFTDVPLTFCPAPAAWTKLFTLCLLAGTQAMVGAVDPCCISVVCSYQGQWTRWTVDKKDCIHTMGQNWDPSSSDRVKALTDGWMTRTKSASHAWVSYKTVFILGDFNSFLWSCSLCRKDWISSEWSPLGKADIVQQLLHLAHDCWQFTPLRQHDLFSCS